MAYGLEVKGPNGTSTVFSPAHRFGNTSGARSGSLRLGNSSGAIDVPGASGTSSYTVLLLVDDQGVMSFTKSATSYTVTNIAGSSTDPAVYVAMAVLIG